MNFFKKHKKEDPHYGAPRITPRSSDINRWKKTTCPCKQSSRWTDSFDHAEKIGFCPICHNMKIIAECMASGECQNYDDWKRQREAEFRAEMKKWKRQRETDPRAWRQMNLL